MAITTSEIQVVWPTSNSTGITTGSAYTSGVITHDQTCFQALIMCKADTTSTAPTSGDTVDFYYLRTTGDPDADADSADEYPTTTQGEFLCNIDLNSDDPGLKTVWMPGPFQTAKLYVVNNAAVKVTVSSQILEQRG